MSDLPVIAVCGHARCGTTMVMTMLHAGGIEPSSQSSKGGYEDPRWAGLCTGRWRWLEEERGRAVKLLDPLRWTVPDADLLRCIWLDRDPVEQAKSAAKLLRAMLPTSLFSDDHTADVAASLWRDRPRALERLAAFGPPLILAFEEILAHPLAMAYTIDAWLGRDLDVEAMAAVVVERGPECAPDLTIEQARIS